MMSQPAISKHLTVPENAGLVWREKRGQNVHYGLKEDALTGTLVHFLAEVCPRSRPFRKDSEPVARRNAGIEWQRRRLVRAARAGAIEFRDITLEPDALSRFGAGIEDVRRRLHAVDEAGKLYVGADCAVAIWLRTPGDAWLGGLIGRPVIRQSARAVYDRFADILYAWNRRKGRW